MLVHLLINSFYASKKELVDCFLGYQKSYEQISNKRILRRVQSWFTVQDVAHQILTTQTLALTVALPYSERDQDPTATMNTEDTTIMDTSLGTEEEAESGCS